MFYQTLKQYWVINDIEMMQIYHGVRILLMNVHPKLSWYDVLIDTEERCFRWIHLTACRSWWRSQKLRPRCWSNWSEITFYLGLWKLMVELTRPKCSWKSLYQNHFSSPELKVQVSYSDRHLSVVCPSLTSVCPSVCL
jgi:hypothetical protein